MSWSRPRSPSAERAKPERHWTNATEIHSLHAVRYRSGVWAVNYCRVDQATKQIVSVDLGEVKHQEDCPSEAVCALVEAAERAEVEISGQYRLF